MSRTELLEQLVEAARQIARQLLLAEMTIEDRCDADVEGAYDAMIETMRPLIHALDALPATPGEMVEFSAWEHEDGMIAWYRAGSRHDLIEMSGWTRLGTVRLPLVKETRDERAGCDCRQRGVVQRA